MLGLEEAFSFIDTTGSSEAKRGKSVAKEAREHLPAEIPNDVLIELRLEYISRFGNIVGVAHSWPKSTSSTAFRGE